MAATRHNWWKDLAALSPTIAGLPMPGDEPYWDTATNRALNAAAYNLSGCADHNASIARWADEMANQGVPPPLIEKLLIDLTSRNTYGTFSELAVYGLLLDAAIPFRMQVPMRGTAILNPNGSDLDGVLAIGNPVYFDVKPSGCTSISPRNSPRSCRPSSRPISWRSAAASTSASTSCRNC